MLCYHSGIINDLTVVHGVLQSELIRMAAELEGSMLTKTGPEGEASPRVNQSADLQVRPLVPSSHFLLKLLTCSNTPQPSITLSTCMPSKLAVLQLRLNAGRMALLQPERPACTAERHGVHCRRWWNR